MSTKILIIEGVVIALLLVLNWLSGNRNDLNRENPVQAAPVQNQAAPEQNDPASTVDLEKPSFLVEQ